MLLIFDSHPVQYKAPVYQQLARLQPGSFKVAYASDCSVRGHSDRDFGQIIAWDTPLLAGYEALVLHNERGTPLRGLRSLTGRGIFALLRRERPAAVLISQFLYEADFVMYLSCLMLGIPVWIRHETQDEAFPRAAWKSVVRSLAYRVAYRGVTHAFAIGELNRAHLVRHGMKAEHISFARYCVPDPVGALDSAEKHRLRNTLRTRLKVTATETLLLFSGKLIGKKNPGLILAAMSHLTPDERAGCKLVFVGSGALEETLRDLAAPFGDRVTFAGFINQSQMPQYYLAADILLLSSRRAGETWGLVVNEALHAGCSVVLTEGVGCHREFGQWERVRVITDGDAPGCAKAMRELSALPRSFDWCAARMESYSVRAAAEALAAALARLDGTVTGRPALPTATTP